MSLRTLSVNPGCRLDTEWTFPRTERLTKEQEAELATRIHAGDKEAREALIAHNLELVGWVAARVPRGRLTADEAMSAGMVGLIQAADCFRADQDVRFATYAAHAIRNAIKDAVWDGKHAVRLPRYWCRLSRRGKHVQKGLARHNECRAQAAAIQKMRREDFGDVDLAGPAADDPIELAELAVRKQRDYAEILEAIAALPPREAEIIRLRFGLDGEPPLLLREISERIGLSRSAVGTAESRAMNRLREALIA